jgi:predicted membrane-bound mannosyltransferase
VGTVLAVWRRRDRFALFAGLWAWGLVTAYSLLPYKTPWLTLNYIVPMSITSGYAVQAAWDWVRRLGNKRVTWLALGLMALTLVASLGQSLTLNFFRYDDARLPYVYMQTRRELISLVEEINAIAAQSGSGKQTTITVTSLDYWPLPWYLRDYSFVGYPKQIVAAKDQIIVASETQEHELIPVLADNYRRVGSYPLRPAVTLVLYARNVSK